MVFSVDYRFARVSVALVLVSAALGLSGCQAGTDAAAGFEEADPPSIEISKGTPFTRIMLITVGAVDIVTMRSCRAQGGDPGVRRDGETARRRGRCCGQREPGASWSCGGHRLQEDHVSRRLRRLG